MERVEVVTKASQMARSSPDDEEVIRTAAEAFIRFGFDGMSMRDLAKKCGSTSSLLYYRFGSKEALYSEACQFEIDTFFASVREQLRKYPLKVRRPEILAGAFFDAWLENPNALLLTTGDVIKAQALPDRMQICDHYPTMLGLVRQLCSEQLSVVVSEEFCFSYTAIIFGMCSLIVIDRHYRKVKELPFDADTYLKQKRAMLMSLCGALTVS